MRITDLLSKESIRLDGVSSTKKETIRAMADLMEKSGKISDKNAYVEGLIKREEESTTAVGEGIAIPHYKGSAVTKPGLAAMVIKNGTDFDSIDGEPVKLIFAIAAPDTKENVHLDVLSKLSVLLMDEDFSQKLINAKSVEEFISIIDDAETAKDNAESEQVTTSDKKILAVTGCPTGIAHTYMAAEGLQKAAEKAGVAPEKCLILEDSYAGGLAAKRAGIPYIIVPDINPPSEEIKGSALFVAESLCEVAALFK